MNEYVIKFNGNPNLGDVVSESKVFCKLTKNMPTPSYDYIVGSFMDPNLHGLAGHKWSRLCGFTFKSNVNSAYPIFQFVYVPKLRGPLTRNAHGLHGWYCWKYKANDNREVMSIDNMLATYNFDINKFVHSDMFEKYVPIFISNVQKALAGPVQELVDSISSTKMRQELMQYVNAIKTSLSQIYEVQNIVHYDADHDDSREGTYAAGSEPKAGHAKIAYNADKTYGLRNLDRSTQAASKMKAQRLSQAAKDDAKRHQQSQKTYDSSHIKIDTSAQARKPAKPDTEIFDKYDDIADDYQ